LVQKQYHMILKPRLLGKTSAVAQVVEPYHMMCNW